jgi:hypothetical protein
MNLGKNSRPMQGDSALSAFYITLQPGLDTAITGVTYPTLATTGALTSVSRLLF